MSTDTSITTQSDIINKESTKNNSRLKNSRYIYNKLEEQLNCDNVEQFIIKNKSLDDTLTISEYDVTLKIIEYVNQKDVGIDAYSKADMLGLWKNFDNMTEANYMGFEVFAYVDAVLDCPTEMNSRAYIFIESFDNTLKDMKIVNVGDWYSLAFQLIYIHIIAQQFNVALSSNIADCVWYRLNEKPYTKIYELGNINIKIFHPFTVVWFDVITINDKHNDKWVSNVLHWFEKANAPAKIITMLREIINSTITNIPTILSNYYKTVTIDNNIRL